MKFEFKVPSAGTPGCSTNLGRVKSVSTGVVLAKGSIHNTEAAPMELPPPGKIQRYIITSAQNNTYIHKGVWANILALAKHYDAKIIVGRFTYDMNAYGANSVKPGTKKSQGSLWYDPAIEPYIVDQRVQLGRGLVWCGDTNIIPSASNPLSGFETFSGRQSSIFPHAKIAMRSVAAIQGSGAKLMYTTGTVTMRNYIIKKAGLIAEFHHTYGGLLIEVTSDGVWKVRQLDAEDKSGTFYDLTLKIANGEVTDGHRVEAITWGDIHATTIDPQVLALSATGKNNMLDMLRPKYQFIHDLLEGASVNHHEAKKPLSRFKAKLRGLNVANEIRLSADVLGQYERPWTETVVVNSNHDRWIDRWLDEYDPKTGNPEDAELYFAGNAARYKAARTGKDLVMLEYFIREWAQLGNTCRFLGMDDSFLICNKKIECGAHGDLGANGSRGSVVGLAKVGRRSNIGHTHTAGIYDGLYVAGTSTTFRMGYNHGPSSWTHSHIITYPNGKRTIISMYENTWRAE